jgi:hypothetical protein
MTFRLLVPILALAAFAPANPAAQSAAASVQGVWKTIEVTTTGPGARTFTNLQPNLTIVTARHYARVEVHAESPRPLIADATTATADELRAMCVPFAAEAGAYELTGNHEMTMRPIVAKNPAAMAGGAFTVFSYKLSASTIEVTSLRDQNGPIAYPVTIKAIRVE